MILARHADALLWAGRYLERAENTARCLTYAADSIIQLRSDEARFDGEKLVRTLGLESELAEAGSLESSPQLVAFLLSDRDNAGSLVSSVVALRENLRSVRDRIPIELWEEANGLYLRFPFLGHAQAESRGLHEVLLMVRRACLAMSGVLNEGMRRDEGHAFVVIGRMLERATFTVALLRSDLPGAGNGADAVRMLRLTSSLQAYHRQRRRDPDPFDVMQYLMHAPDLPRSVLSCVGRAEECLKGLGSVGPALTRSRRRAGVLRVRLELGETVEGMEAEPAQTLDALAEEFDDLALEVQSGLVPPLEMTAVRSQYVRPGAMGVAAGVWPAGTRDRPR